MIFLPTIISALAFNKLALAAAPLHSEPYPEVLQGLKLDGYSYNDEIPIECIQRNMDTGEHLFDENENIIYAPFPKCFETDASLTLRYGVDEVFNCTIDLGHEFFHVFQLYIHEDVPFSCRIPYTKKVSGTPAGDKVKRHGDHAEEGVTSVEPAAAKTTTIVKKIVGTPKKPSNTIYIPLTFMIRGVIQESHLDIDPEMNIVLLSNTTAGRINSGIAFSAGSSVQRFIIGDSLPLRIATRWYKAPTLPSASTAYFAGSATRLYSFATFICTVAICAAIFYGYIFPKKLKSELRRSLPVANAHGAFDKTD